MKGSQRGFTLIEVLIAATITALLLATVYGVFSSVGRAKARLETESEGYHQARVIFDRIGREIRGAYYIKENAQTRFRGGLDEEKNPFLLLSTTATTPQGGRQEGIALVGYRLRRDEEARGKKVLTRSEAPLLNGGETPREHRLATGIEALALRFSDGNDWQEEWDSTTQGAAPKLVEVTLDILLDGAAVPFRSRFEVPVIEAP